MRQLVILLLIFVSFGAHAALTGEVENILPDGTITGWACDPAAPTGSVAIRIFQQSNAGGPPLLLANQIFGTIQRPDIAKLNDCTGPIGFHTQLAPRTFVQPLQLIFKGTAEGATPSLETQFGEPINVQFVRTATRVAFDGRIQVIDAIIPYDSLFAEATPIDGLREPTEFYIRATGLTDNGYIGLRYQGNTGQTSPAGQYLMQGYEGSLDAVPSILKTVYSDYALEVQGTVNVNHIEVSFAK